MTLLAAYNFDEASGAALDVTGSGHDFALPVGASRVAGASGHGSALTTSGGANVGPAIFGQTTQRTLMMRLRMPADFTIGWVFEWHDSTADTGRWGLLSLNGSFGFRAGSSTGYASIARPTDTLDHHYAGTFDGSVTRLYMDGALVATSSTVSGGIPTTADVLNVFNITTGTPPVIDDVRVYDTALDAATIAALVNTPVGAPTSEDHAGAASLAGSGAITLSGSPAASGALSASGGGILTLSGRASFSGAVALSGGGSLAEGATPAPSGDLAASGDGTLTASPDSLAVSSPLATSGSGDLAASSTAAASGSLALSGVGSLTPAPYVAPAFVDLDLTASMADGRWSASLADTRWSAVMDPDPWTGAVES